MFKLIFEPFKFLAFHCGSPLICGFHSCCWLQFMQDPCCIWFCKPNNWFFNKMSFVYAKKHTTSRMINTLFTWYGCIGWFGIYPNGGANCCGGICQFGLPRALFKSCADVLNGFDRESDSVPSSCVVISSESLKFWLKRALPFLKWLAKFERLPDLIRAPNELDRFVEFRLSLLIR